MKTNDKNPRTSHGKANGAARDDVPKDSPSAAPTEQLAEVSSLAALGSAAAEESTEGADAEVSI